MYALLIPGLFLTARRRVGSRYWTWTAAALLLLLVGVHFNPDPRSESLRDLYMPYAAPAEYCGRTPPVDPPMHGAGWLCGPPPAPPRLWLGALALTNLGILIAACTALFVVAFRARRRRRRNGAG